MTLRDQLTKGPLLLDGAMGSLLQRQPITARQWSKFEGCNEWLNLSAPEVICELHNAYLEAGSDVVQTNTFGSSPGTLGEYGLSERAYEISKAAAQWARECANVFSTPGQSRYVLGSIGPGTKLPSLGQIRFDELYADYTVQVRGLLDGGVDGLIIETCQDPLQIKAALAAAGDLLGPNSDIVCYVSVTVESSGTLLVGTSVLAIASILAHYPIDVLGLNCATGPDAMEHPIHTLSEIWPNRLACMPNAGMPVANEKGDITYPLNPQSFAEKVGQLITKYGLSMVGGCCGTTPEHIRQLRKKLDLMKVDKRNCSPCKTDRSVCFSQIASLFSPVDLTQRSTPLLIGERANATGSKRFREALLSNDYENAFHILTEQEETGADVLDLNCGYAGRDERKDIAILVPRIARECRIPFMIDSTSPEVIEDALKAYGGRAIINSIHFEDGDGKAKRIVSMARRYGAAIVGLTLDEKGMGKRVEEKVAIARRLRDFCVEQGLGAEEILIDPLTFTVCSGDETLRDAAIQTLESIRRIKAELPGVQTILGLSNISFGLRPPARRALNAVFLHQAIRAGLDACIIHVATLTPLNQIPDDIRTAAEALLNNDMSLGDPLENYILFFENVKNVVEKNAETHPADEVLAEAIIRGKARWLDHAISTLLKEKIAEEILNQIMLPAMKEVGRLFNTGVLQLPFVLKSAEVMKRAVDLIRPFLQKNGADHHMPKIVLATVAGDVHDIGKNLVGILLSNNGFDVIDLGIKVSVEKIVEALKEHRATAIGMSGLLVKSTAVMAENIQYLERIGIDVPVMLGGAALSKEFVEQVCCPNYSGEVVYCKDAFDSLVVLQQLKETGQPLKKNTPAHQECHGSLLEKNEPIANLISVEVPIPDIVIGTQITEKIDLDEVWNYLDLPRMISAAWGYKKCKHSPKAYQKLLDQEIDPNVLKMKQFGKQVFEPKILHGFFNCRSLGDSLFIEHSGTGEEIQMTFLRQKQAPYHCLSDFFRPDGDIAALLAVTLGPRVSDQEKTLRKADLYCDYLLFHGLATMTAEALTEYGHTKIRQAWGSEKDVLTLAEIRKRKLDQRRFGFGYAACPDLAMNKMVFDLLNAGRIGLNVTELFMVDPEISTLSLVTHHPQAYHLKITDC